MNFFPLTLLPPYPSSRTGPTQVQQSPVRSTRASKYARTSVTRAARPFTSGLPEALSPGLEELQNLGILLCCGVGGHPDLPQLLLRRSPFDRSQNLAELAVVLLLRFGGGVSGGSVRGLLGLPLRLALGLL